MKYYISIRIIVYMIDNIFDKVKDFIDNADKDLPIIMNMNLISFLWKKETRMEFYVIKLI